MTVTKCDRCGKDIIDSNSAYLGTCVHIYPKMKITYDDVRIDSDCVEETEGEVDLCEDCQKEVYNFIFGKEEEEAHDCNKM